MVSSRWPLSELRLQTPELVLRWPSPDDLYALADLAAAGVHDPEVQPFMVAWTDASPEERARSTLQYHWSCWGSWKPSDWTLELAVVRDGVVVGSQGVGGRDFAVLREVHTGSWLGRRYQGQGIGTQMRAAVLALAFDGLEAQSAVSAAFEDNPASLGVSRKLGYRDDGIEWHLVRCRPDPPAPPRARQLAGHANDPGGTPWPAALPAPFRADRRQLTSPSKQGQRNAPVAA